MSRVPASPYLFRPLARSLGATVFALVVMAIWMPAPLDLPADPMTAPNPAKSAWFLLWIQELVAYRTIAIYLPIALAMALVALPWLWTRPVDHAAWFQRTHRPVWIAALLLTGAVTVLTLIALLLRGEDWCLVSPW